MIRMYGWSEMIYGSLQTEFMVAKHNGHIHIYGTLIFSNIIVYGSEPINNDNQIIWMML